MMINNFGWGLGYGLATYSHKNYILKSNDEQEGRI
jgi:hypothetical protein